MKKLVLGVLVAVLVALGLSAPTAHAADPYAGTVVSTPAHKYYKIKVGQRPRVVLVAESGFARPVGFAYVTCRTLPHGKFGVHRKGAVRNGVVPMPRLHHRKLYRCYIKFNGAGVYKNALSVVKVRVV